MLKWMGMTSNKKFLLISLSLVFFFFIFVSFYKITEKYEIVLGGKVFKMEVADTDASRALGLSGHAPLADSEGMIFVFEKPDAYGFWMKDMNFPIDIIWIDENLKILQIEHSLKPETFPKIFYGSEKTLYVLEITGGQSIFLNLKIGDSIKFVKR